MLNEILSKFIDPVDSSLRVHRDKLENQMQDLEIGPDRITTIFQYLKDNHFLDYANLNFLMSHECGIYLVHQAYTLFENKYISPNQLHQLITLLFSNPTLVFPMMSITDELTRRNLCHTDIVNTVLTTQNLEALSFCEEKLEFITDPQYVELLCHILRHFQITKAIDNNLTDDLKELLNFLSTYGLLSVDNINDGYKFLSHLAGSLKSLTALQYPKDIFDLLINHPSNADIIAYIAQYIGEDLILKQNDEDLINLFFYKKEIFDFYRVLDAVLMPDEARLTIKKSIIEAAKDDISTAIEHGSAQMTLKAYEARTLRKIPDEVISLIFSNQTPDIIANMVIAVDTAFPNANLNLNFIPLMTFIAYARFIHRSQHVNELLTAYKAIHADSYCIFHKTVSANPNNIHFLVDIVKNLKSNPSDKMKICIYLFLISVDPQAQDKLEAGVLTHDIIEDFKKVASDISDFLLGLIYSGVVKAFESIKDATLANDYYKKIPDSSIWHIKAQEALLANNKNTAPVTPLLNNLVKKQVRIQLPEVNQGSSASKTI